MKKVQALRHSLIISSQYSNCCVKYSNKNFKNLPRNLSPHMDYLNVHICMYM